MAANIRVALENDGYGIDAWVVYPLPEYSLSTWTKSRNHKIPQRPYQRSRDVRWSTNSRMSISGAIIKNVLEKPGEVTDLIPPTLENSYNDKYLMFQQANYSNIQLSLLHCVDVPFKQ